MKAYIDETIAGLKAISDDSELAQTVAQAIEMICESIRSGNPLLVCGNGGSASDAMHISGELVGRFNLVRRAINVICLSSNPVVLTAWSNDESFESVFSRQVEAYGSPGSVLLGLSTSGNSKNVLEAFMVARRLGIHTIGMSGQSGGDLGELSDCLIRVPAIEAAKVQNLHVPIYHWICSEVERQLATC